MNTAEFLNKLQSNWSNYSKEKQEKIANALDSLDMSMEKLMAILDEE